MINHRDDELRRAKKRIEDLERQRFKVKRDCRRARNDIERLKRMLEGRRGRDSIPPEVRSQKSPNRSSAKRVRISNRLGHKEKTPQRDEGSTFKRVRVT